MECCSLWLIGSAGRCLLVKLLVRLNLVSFLFSLRILLLSLEELFHHNFHQLLWVEIRWCLLFLCGFSLSSASLESLLILWSINLADCSKVSLSFSLGVSIESHELFLLEFPTKLGWFHNLSHWLSWGLDWSHDFFKCRPGERWRPCGLSMLVWVDCSRLGEVRASLSCLQGSH